jgi:hypothetical protein
MATHTYRFRRQLPFEQASLDALAGAGMSVVSRAGGFVVDIQADDTQFSDLVDAAEGSGLVYLSTDPASEPESDVEVVGKWRRHFLLMGG